MPAAQRARTRSAGVASLSTASACVEPGIAFAQVPAQEPEHPQRAGQPQRRPGPPRSVSQANAARRLACSASSRSAPPTVAPVRAAPARPVPPAPGTTPRAGAWPPPRRRWPRAAPARTRGRSPASGSAARPSTRLLPAAAGSRRRGHATPDQRRSASPRSASSWRPATRLGRLEREAADEDRQPPEQRLPILVQQVVAPGDGVAHRPQPLRGIARSPGQQRQPLLQPRQQRRRRQRPDSRRRQLDRQGQPIQPAGRPRPLPPRSPRSGQSPSAPPGRARRRGALPRHAPGPPGAARRSLPPDRAGPGAGHRRCAPRKRAAAPGSWPGP